MTPSVPANSKFPQAVVQAAMASASPVVLASVTLAQWALESAYGKAVSGKWNYGGITAKVKDAVFPFKPGTPLEPATLCWTHEDWQGQRVQCQRWFKDFDSPDGFFQAHAKLLATSGKYAAARAKLPDLNAYIDAMGPVYATGKGYAESLKSIIRTNNLTQYDVHK